MFLVYFFFYSSNNYHQAHHIKPKNPDTYKKISYNFITGSYKVNYQTESYTVECNNNQKMWKIRRD